MKIDIHTHTRKCKSGDAPTREISPEKFCETILSTEVRIVAITNHNVFDLQQFRAIETRLAKAAQVWPGIEFDVLEGASRGHLLVIVSPAKADIFSKAVGEFTKASNPDKFTATIAQVLATFDPLGPVYVAHYKMKKPNLSDDSIAKLLAGTANPARVIKEVTNSISAGIYISHGHASIYGSDIHDWAKYQQEASALPDLRLPVDSFEHFCLLLAKDPTTINTALDKKTPEELVLHPFEDGSTLKIRAFNDINVFFGPKGTGKSCILKAIAKHYADNGTVDAKVYESRSDRLDEIFDTKGKDLSVNLNDHGINYCTDAIRDIRAAGEVGVTSLSKYSAHYLAKVTNVNAKKILLKDIEPEMEAGIKQEFSEFYEAVNKTEEFLEFLASNVPVTKELAAEELQRVTKILSELLDRLSKREWTNFSEWKQIELLNSAIKKFRDEVHIKTGAAAKPTTTGFLEYAKNRMQIERNAAEVIKSIQTTIPRHKQVAGNLGTDKGDLSFITEVRFQTGDVADGSLQSLKGVKKTAQREFADCIRIIHSHAYSDNLFQKIAKLNEIEDVEDIKTVYELLMFRRYFAIEEIEYSPSSGEASMIMLQKELGAEKEVYILDEPERSLGNEYISEVIVPLIKERARTHKKVFISTHDANIAVRTLPYSSIYRCHGKDGYRTYAGNPYSNNLVNLADKNDQLDWKKISMRTLEGGEEAFGERGTIYGNS